MGALNFRVKLEIKDTNLKELAVRVKDYSPAFVGIIAAWADENANKFKKGEGNASEGASQSGGVNWEALTPDYIKSKAKRTSAYPDAIMMRSGSLMQSLTAVDAFEQFVSANKVAFGIPKDADDAVKAVNKKTWRKRPTIFLDAQDKFAIKREIQNYLTFGENYQKLLSSAGLAAVYEAKMDAEFAGVVA